MVEHLAEGERGVAMGGLGPTVASCLSDPVECVTALEHHTTMGIDLSVGR